MCICISSNTIVPLSSPFRGSAEGRAALRVGLRVEDRVPELVLEAVGDDGEDVVRHLEHML